MSCYASLRGYSELSGSLLCTCFVFNAGIGPEDFLQQPSSCQTSTNEQNARHMQVFWRSGLAYQPGAESWMQLFRDLRFTWYAAAKPPQHEASG